MGAEEYAMVYPFKEKTRYEQSQRVSMYQTLQIKEENRGTEIKGRDGRPQSRSYNKTRTYCLQSRPRHR